MEEIRASLFDACSYQVTGNLDLRQLFYFHLERINPLEKFYQNIYIYISIISNLFQILSFNKLYTFFFYSYRILY